MMTEMPSRAHRRRTLAIATSFALLLFATGAIGASASAKSVTASSVASANESIAKKREIVIAGYGGPTPAAFKKHIFTPFTKSTGIPVTWATVPAGVVAGVQAQKKAKRMQWDAAFAMDGVTVQELRKAGYLATAPTALVRKLKKNIPDITTYAIPYARGANLMVCNAKAVKACPTTIAQFFDVTNYPGKRTMPVFQPVVALALAAQASGTPPSKVYPINMSDATAKLDSIRSSIPIFFSSSDQLQQLLRNGEIDMAIWWNGNAQGMAADPGRNVDLKVSWNGATVFSTYNVVLKGAPSGQDVWKLVAWIDAHPKAVALAQMAEGGGASGADRRVNKYLPKSDLPWSVASHPGLAVEDTAWYTSSPKVKNSVDDFWKTYTSG